MKNNNARLARTARHTAPAASFPSFAHWRFSALAAAIVACASLHAPDARALTLGTVTVQSALGEPLRAEIDLPQITVAEAESLRAGTASADVFRMQGMEYSATVSQMRVQLQRRPDGRTVLRLSGTSPVNEPFVDLVLDAQWNAGHVTRSYTLLFDPPAPRRSQAAPVLSAPSISASENRNPPPPARRSRPGQSSAMNGGAGDNAENAVPPTPASPRRTAIPARTPAGPATAENTVEVRPGDTAGRIANARRQQGVSLDQMLVALSRANPSAFVEGNVNRLKSGSVLQIPSQSEALATPANQARQIVAVQSRDFNAFRRNIASAVPDAGQAGAQRSASGSVQIRTEDSSATSTAPDKLTLSKGAMQGKKTTEEMLAQRKQGNEAAARAQELARNIEELNRLNAASGTSAVAASAPPTDNNPTTAATATAAPGLTLPNPGLALPTDPAAPSTPSTDTAKVVAPENTAATEGISGTAPAAAVEPPKITSETAAAPLAATPAPRPEPQPEPDGFVQDMLDQPALAVAGGALLLLLLYGGYRAVQSRRRHVALDSGFVDSRVHPDSFFGASGGQRVDTASAANSTIGGTSLSYSPSQLDVGGEVDPVAEADVYLAYGRDLQAEEILREAARQHPQRVSIPAKLGEIYAKRLDSKALEAAAHDVHRLTQGKGPEWEHMAKLGRQLEPDNVLYHASSAVPLTAGLAGAAALGLGGSLPVDGASSTRPLDLDLNLDFDLPDDALSEATAEDLHPGTASDTKGMPAPLAGAEDWDALEDLVAFNAAIALPPKPEASPIPPARTAEHSPTPAAPIPPAAPLTTAFQGNVLDTGPDTHAAQQADGALHPSVDMHLDWRNLPPAQPEASETDALVQANHTDTTVPSTAALDAFALNFDLPDLDSPFSPACHGTTGDSPQLPEAAAAELFVPNGSHLMEFDFDSLSLDLDAPQTGAVDPAGSAMETGASATNTAASAEEPLNTKLALAQEFHAIGDSEGARTLIDEVIAESSGTVRARAQSLLMELG